MTADAKPPWERPDPTDGKDGATHHLTPAQKASARKHAKAAGRPYPNLVDNMREARKAHK